MPREKKVKHARILVLYFDVSLYEELKGVAQEMGVSMSELARHVLSEWMRRQRQEVQASASAPLDPPLAPPVRDPLEELELEELRGELEGLEREVGELARVVQQLQKLGWDAARSLHLPERYQLRERVYRKLKRWHSLRRLLRRLSQHLSHEELFALSSQMAEVKKRLNDLLAALG